MPIFDPYAASQQATTEQPQEELSTFDKYLGIGSPAQRFVAGAVNEPLMAVGQMVVDPFANILGYGKPVTEYAQRIAQLEQQGRAARGDTGIDTAKLAGAIVSPVTLLPAGRVAQAAGSGIRGGILSGGITAPLAAPTLSEDLVAGKAEQSGYGMLGGGIGAAVTQGVGRALAPRINADEQLLRDLGIQPTTGETVGGIAKKAEEFAARIPGVSALVSPARQASVESFNTAMFNRVLSNIKGANLGKEPPKLGKDVIGMDAMRELDTKISESYDKILPNMKYRLNTNTFQDISDVIRSTGLNDAQQETVVKFMSDRFLNKIKQGNGQLDGDTLKVFEADLRKKIASYSGVSKGGADLEIGDTLKEIRSIFRNDLYTQNSKFVPELRKVDKAYAEAEVIRDAVNRVAPEKQGVFTPNDLSMAVRSASGKLGEKARSRGDAMLQREAQAAVNVMGGADKSTANVGALGAAYVGLGNPAAAILTAGGIGAAYTKYGQKAIDALVTKRPEMLQRIGNAIQSAGSITPAISAQIERLLREEQINVEPQGGVQIFDPFQNSKPISSKPQLQSQLQTTIQQKQVPPELARVIPALVQTESSWNPNAANKNSSAKGLFQMTNAARADVGIPRNATIQQDIEGGIDYLLKMYRKYGDVTKAIQAYNQGHYNPKSKEGKKYVATVYRNM